MSAAPPADPDPAPRIVPVGDAALLVELGQGIDDAVNARVLALARRVRGAAPAGVTDVVPTYRSLLLRFDPDMAARDALAATVRDLLGATGPERGGEDAETAAGRLWQVPVVYGGPFGLDLEGFAAHHGLPPAEVVRRHAAPLYRVHMIGFQPGFAYLGGLDPSLARSRRTEPRARTPAGSVSVGGAQAAVASVEAPSGWHLLGRTPARPFMPGREPAFLLEPGDRVRLEPVPAAAWEPLDRRAAAGEPVAELARA